MQRVYIRIMLNQKIWSRSTATDPKHCLNRLVKLARESKYYICILGEILVNGQKAIANLDIEWLELMMEAKRLGLEIDGVREFINQKQLPDRKAYQSAICSKRIEYCIDSKS